MVRVQKRVTLEGKGGLHLRAACIFVQTASRFNCDVKVKKVGSSSFSDGKSLLSLLSLGIGCGDKILVITEGSDAKEALAALVELIRNKFGESE